MNKLKVFNFFSSLLCYQPFLYLNFSVYLKCGTYLSNRICCEGLVVHYTRNLKSGFFLLFFNPFFYSALHTSIYSTKKDSICLYMMWWGNLTNELPSLQYMLVPQWIHLVNRTHAHTNLRREMVFLKDRFIIKSQWVTCRKSIITNLRRMMIPFFTHYESVNFKGTTLFTQSKGQKVREQ